MTDSRPALALTDLGSVNLQIMHCHVPMRYVSERTWWSGKPGEGSEMSEVSRICDTCGASALVNVAEPA